MTTVLRCCATAFACTLITLVAPAVSQADDDKALWLSLDFDESLDPASSVPKDITVTFVREGEAYGPDGKVAATGKPRFTKGLSGQGVFIGRGATNILSKALADIDFEGGMVKGVQPVQGATLGQDKTSDAWTGDTALKVTTGNEPGSGASFPLTIPGGEHDNGSPKLFVFSAHVKADADLEMSVSVQGNDDDNWFSPPVTIKAGDDWQRPVVWLFAKEATTATVSLVTKDAGKTDFLIDGLQLEEKSLKQMGGTPTKAPYGKDYDADPWTPGGTTSQTERLLISWKDAEFPNAEGTLSVWVKPLFNRGDANTHPVVSRSHVYYQLTFQNFNQYSFYRTNQAENAEKNRWGDVRVGRPETFVKGEWALLTATWSNKDKVTKLYYNGELLGEKESVHNTDNGKTNRLFVGTWANEWALNGVIDSLRIYSRAMTHEEIFSDYDDNMPR